MPTIDKKDQTYCFRASSALLAAAKVRARQDDSTLSDALRLLLTDYVDGRTAPVHVARELYRYRKELHKLGVNLNQLTRAANSGCSDIGSDLSDLIARLAASVREALFRLHEVSRWKA